METLTELIETGKLTPSVGGTYRLDEVPEAIRHLVDGQARGKLVIKV